MRHFNQVNPCVTGVAILWCVGFLVVGFLVGFYNHSVIQVQKKALHTGDIVCRANIIPAVALAANAGMILALQIISPVWRAFFCTWIT